jgi:SAM-dependent methyltransferase
MTDPPFDIRTLYESVYGDVSAAHELVRRDGHRPGDDIGQCGYTLPEQLQRLATLLELGPGRRFLDVGCGLGGPTRYLATHARCEGVGIDFAVAGVGRAVAENEVPVPHFLVADAASLPLPAASLDAIVSFDVVLYLPDRDGFLCECRRVLRPGGRVAIVDEVERGAGLTAAEREARALFGPAVYETEASHRERLERIGFAGIIVEDWTPAFVALNERWCAAREKHRTALIAEGSERTFAIGTRYFETNRDTARDGRLARVLMVGWTRKSPAGR